MWCLTAPGAVVHRIRDDKSAATFKELVGDYKGTIVADALGTHEAGAREGPGIVLAGCWAHVFRRFEEALPDHPDAERALEWIGALYDIDRRGERELARIAELRRAEAPAILAEFKNWLLDRAGDTHVSIGKAAAYTLGIWDRLTRFVDDARIPLDNNASNVVCGISGVMPRPGSCRGRIPCRGRLSLRRKWARHNQRLSRNVSRRSFGRNRVGAAPRGSACPSARSFRFMSA
jgi:hypothetical protein